MEKVQIFCFENAPVTFCQTIGSIMINATEMAKHFGKQPSDWTRLKQTEEFLSSLSTVRGIPRTKFIQIRQGGQNRDCQGTWMHEDVALEFARWLSPLFAIWCNDRVKELLRYGVTATQPVLQRMDTNPEAVLQVLDHLRKGYEQGITLQRENDLLINRLDAQTHKVEFYDHIHQCRNACDSKRIYRISQIASEIGLSGAELNQILQRKGIQRKRGKIWILTDRYAGREYTRERTFQDGYDEDGEPTYCVFTVWTALGREFILSLFD